MTFPSLSDSISVNDSQADEELVENLKNAIQKQLRVVLARDLGSATKSELWMATSLMR